MKKIFFTLVIATALISCSASKNSERLQPRILVSTDIGGTDPDDNQSMLHLLMYSDKFEIEGLVSSPSYGEGSKEEILRMIDIYELDYPALKAAYPDLKSPDSLRPLCKQGRHGLAPLAGYETATEGSDWIIECARREDERPLYVLVWGSLEDVSQALHDAPDIASKIRVYYIGGPNKKWGVNSHAYVAENFPELWMIENNASYRGLISNSNDTTRYHAGYYNYALEGAGNIGADFVNYYNGVVKMGDTPSLLYMMDGDPADPEGESWGGSFELTDRTPRRIVTPSAGACDTVPVYSVVEFSFSGPTQDLPVETRCFTITLDKQQWPGYYMGDGRYFVRYSPKRPETLTYEIVSDNGAFEPFTGTLEVDGEWPGEAVSTDYKMGSTWWTDRRDPTLYQGKWQGAETVAKHRTAILDDWATRLSTLKSATVEE